MSNVVVTTSGTGFMATAGTMFPAIPIRYFIPYYDYRIDPYVMPTSGLTQVSAAETTSATSVFGEAIYNIDSLSTSAYTITNNEFLLRDSNQSGTSTITNNRFDGTSVITLLNGRPLSHAISGTSIVYNYPNWTVAGYTMVSGSNPVPTGYASSRDKFFRVTSFAPITSAAGGQASGLFKVMLDNLKGNFKFNKIALYAARILSGGVEDTSIEPVLVAIAYFNRPVIKSNDGSNLNFIEADIEIQFAASNYFGNVSYLSNNNWNYVGGENILWGDAKIAIGTSAVPGSWLARAKLHITEDNEAIPLQRWTRDNSTYTSDMFLEDAGSSELFQMFRSHRPNYRVLFETSGAESGNSWSKIGLETLHNSLTRSIDMYMTHPTSGSHRSGMEAVFEGYLEKLNVSVDGENFLTARGLQSSYGTIVLGRSSDTLFEHPGKFLTVHGGSLFVGSSLVSGTLSGGDLIPNTITTTGLIFSTNSIIGSNFATGMTIGTGPGGLFVGRNLSISTSAYFAGNVTFDNGGTVSGGTLVPNSITTEGLIVTTNGIVSPSILTGLLIGTGSGGIIAGRNLSITTSAHFAGPITVSNTISAGSTITAYSLEAGQLSVGGQGVISNLLFGTANGNSLQVNGDTYLAGNLNVSGLAALGSNLNLDSGSLQIRRKGYGLTANITSVAAAGSAPMTASFSNGESFGIVTGWTTSNTLRILTTKANSGNIILYSIYGTGGTLGDMVTRISSISNGSYFEIECGTTTTGVTVYWMIIPASS